MGRLEWSSFCQNGKEKDAPALKRNVIRSCGTRFFKIRGTHSGGPGGSGVKGAGGQTLNCSVVIKIFFSGKIVITLKLRIFFVIKKIYRVFPTWKVNHP